MTITTKALERLVKVTEALKTNNELNFSEFSLVDPTHKEVFNILRSGDWVLVDLEVSKPTPLSVHFGLVYIFHRKEDREPESFPLTYRIPIITKNTHLKMDITKFQEFQLSLLITQKGITPLYEVQLLFNRNDIPQTFEKTIKPWLKVYEKGLPI